MNIINTKNKQGCKMRSFLKLLPVWGFLPYLLVSMTLSVSAQNSETMPIDSLISKADLLAEEGQIDSAIMVLISRQKQLDPKQNKDDYFGLTAKIGYFYMDKFSGEGIAYLEQQTESAKEIQNVSSRHLGNIYEALADQYMRNLDYAKGNNAADLSLRYIKEVDSEDIMSLVSVYIIKANCLMELGKLSEAEQIITSVLQQCEEDIEDVSSFSRVMYSGYNCLGIIYKEQSKFEEAINAYMNAMKYAKKFPGNLEVGVVNYNIGFAYLLDNRHKKALQPMTECIKIFIENFGETHGFVAASYHILSQCYRPIDLEQENFYTKKTLDITKKLYSEKHVRTGISYLSYAISLVNIGKEEEGLIYYRKADKVFTAVLPPYHPLKAENYKVLTLYFTAESTFDVDSIFLYAKKTIEQADSSGVDLRENKTVALRAMSLAYRKTENYGKSFETLALAKETNSIYTDIYRSEKRPFLLEQSFFNHLYLSETYAAKWRKEQNPADLSAAYEQIKITNQVYLEAEQDENKTYEMEAVPVPDKALSLAYEMYRAKLLDTSFELLFDWYSRKKAKKIRRAFKASQAVELLAVGNSFPEKEKQLNQEKFLAEQKLYEAKKVQDSTEIERIYTEVLPEILDKKQNLREKIKEEYPKYYNIKYENPQITSESIQEIIRPEELVICFNISDDDSLALALLIEKNSTEVVDLPDLRQNLDKIKTLNTLLQSPTLFRTDKRKQFIVLAHELYKQFIAPIDEHLQGKKHLVIMGDGMTHYLPFEVLLKSKEVKPFQDLDYLVKEYEISYHYSPTLFVQSRRKESRYEEGLLAFAPIFSEEISRTPAPESTRGSEYDTLSTAYRAVDVEGNYTPLTHSLEEVNQIAEMVEKNSSSKPEVLLYGKANEENLKSKLEKPHRFVHIASHSFANLRESKFSGIACAPPADSTSTEDGILYVGEVYNLDIPADLVVLSSCESGLGQLQSGEGLIGLNRSFIYSGVPNVVFSLWKVNDKVSSEMMVHFYKKIFEGKNYAAALREAKLQLMKEETTASPNLWSSFLLIGR